MRVIIAVHTGPKQGSQYVLRDNQMMTFGRTEEADVAITADSKMSAVHFQISNVGNECVVTDAGSRNGIQINGVPVKQASLSDGDLVFAGQTTFRVCMEGLGANKTSASPLPASPVIRPTPLMADVPAVQPLFRVESCGSGLRMISGAMLGEPQPPVPISQVACPLARRLAQYVIIDFRKAELPVPKDLSDAVPLFDWIPPQFAADNSPLILLPTSKVDVASLLDLAWDKDAVVVIYSTMPSEELVRHLKAATRMNFDGSMPERGHAHGMLGYCWPSVLAPLLAFQKAEFVNALLAGIDAVLIEIPDLPGTWQVFCQNGFPDVLVSAGFRPFPGDEPPREVMTPFGT